MPQPVFAKILANAQDPRYTDNGRAPLPSAYQTRIAYGMNDYAFSRAVNVVGGAGAQAQLPAWKQVFVARRLAWAVEDLESTGRSAPLSAVARNAKLRIATIQRHSSQ
ncbi:hypothetical protein PQQ81_32350 [Paraburkholderia strydomiana]|uniref:hypothetical protein n=1 Tax=Paraburkholderia strydomiana TaxID=1245417 RepID=UPI0038BB1729